MTSKALAETGEQRPAPRVSPQAIQERKEQIGLLQGMVRDLLIHGVDYGRIPGTPQDSLWDPGASQIIGAFNCFPGERRILKFEDTDDKISICIEVPIISHDTNLVVTTGIGAASTLESKYKYRFVDNPKEWGYDEESIKALKFDKKKQKYRIPNPEHSELLNTILKMSSKRAEVDAAESLPGVASALRQMFTGQAPKAREAEGPRWQRFWGEVTRLGYTEEEAHHKLGVPSMKAWLSSGRSLDQALDVLRGKERQAPAGSRDPETVKTISDLYRACNEDFNMQPADVIRELGVTSQGEISDTPAECYRRIAVVR